MLVKARLLLTISQLLTFLFVSTFAQGRAEDSLALVAFLNANPEGALNWDLDQSLDNWSGVTLDGSGRVSSIKVEFSSIRTIPDEVGALSELIKLELPHNDIDSVSKAIGALSKLEKLNLNGNEITSIPSEIGNLSALIELNLNANKMNAIPSEVGNLSKLENFYLSDNKNFGALPSEIGNLSALKKVIVTNTMLCSLPSSFGDLGNLEYINFEGNALEKLPEELSYLVPKSFDGKFVYISFSSNFLRRNALPLPTIEWLDKYAYGWEDGQQQVYISYSAVQKESETSFSLRNGVLSLPEVGTKSNSISIVNSLGRKICTFDSQSKRIDLRNLSSGVYFVHMLYDTKRIVYPIQL